MSVIYEVDVPPNEQAQMRDMPTRYRVVAADECDIEGLYGGQWESGPPVLWLVMHLLARLKTQEELSDER